MGLLQQRTLYRVDYGLNSSPCLYVTVTSADPTPTCCSLVVWLCLTWGNSWRKDAQSTVWRAALPLSLQWTAPLEWTTSSWSAKWDRAHCVGISGRLEAAELLGLCSCAYTYMHKTRTEAAEVLVVVSIHKGRTKAAKVLAVVLIHIRVVQRQQKCL